MTLQSDNERPPLALVVDDDPVLRMAVKQFVERLGFETRDAPDGRQALVVFDERCPDIVLLDAAMPEMDGFATCEAIRSRPDGAHIPVIIITMYEDEGSVDHAFAVGADEYITKPVHWAVLRNRALHLVKSYRAERRLRDDHTFFQCLVDSIPDPTVVVDTDLVVRWLNGSAPGFFALGDARLGRPFNFQAEARILDDNATPAVQLLNDVVSDLPGEDETVECVLAVDTGGDERAFAHLYLRVLRGVQGDTQGFILRLQDVTARERERERLRQEASDLGDLARHDALTGLANRMLFEERLRAMVAAPRSDTDARIALLFLDLDGFKAVNDTRGHGAGDQVLCTVASRLEMLVRRGDLVARLGGDEFGVLLQDAHDEEALATLAGRLLESIRAPVWIDGHACRVTASIGIGLYPDHAGRTEALVQCADTAMYAVKSAGKEGFRFAEPGCPG